MNIRILGVTLAGALAVGAAGAQDIVLTDSWSTETTVSDDVSFGTSESPASPCAVALPAARGANTLTLYPSSTASPFVFSGETLTFGLSGVLRQLGGAAVFDLPVADTTSRGLSFESDAEKLTYSATFVPKTNAVLFPNRNLNDLMPVRSHLNGANVCGWANAYYVQRGDGWLTVDFQSDASVDPNYIKGVRVRLEQQGADVVGRVTLAFFWDKGNGGPGVYPADSPYVNSTSIATSTASGAYGVDILNVVVATPASTRFSKSFAVDGRLSLAPFRDVVLTNAASAGVNLSFTNDLVLAEGATFTLEAETNLTVKGKVYGTNATFAVHSLPAPTTTDETTVKGVSASTLNKGTWSGTLVAKGRRATDIVRLEKPYLNVSSDGATVISTEWASDRSSVTYQVQVKSDWLKMVFVKFYDAGDGVRSILTRSCYSEKLDFGKDFRGRTSLGEYQSYYLYSSQLVFTNNAQGVVELTGADNMLQGTVKVLPGAFATVPGGACPRSGTVEVGAGARMQSSGLNGTRALSLVARAGSVVTIDGQVGAPGLAYNVPLTLDGAELQFRFAGGEIDGETGCYVQDITFKNGARVIGGKMRVTSGALRTVTGTGVQMNEAGMLNCCSGSGGTAGTMTVDVADTTGDGGADYVVTGPITYYNSSYQGLTLLKKGAGTLRQEGTVNSAMTLPIRVEGGRFELGKSNVMNGSKQTFRLSGGGGISVAAGCTNTVGAVTLAGDGAIDLGKKACLKVADSSGATWTAGKVLRVTAPDMMDPGLRFGTTAAGLTATQLRQIRVNGGRAKIDENGYVSRDLRGLVFTLR